MEEVQVVEGARLVLHRGFFVPEPGTEISGMKVVNDLAPGADDVEHEPAVENDHPVQLSAGAGMKLSLEVKVALETAAHGTRTHLICSQSAVPSLQRPVRAFVSLSAADERL